MRNQIVSQKPSILLTCPHMLLSGDCKEANDPGAIESATELWNMFQRYGFSCALIAGSMDRSTCDLNRKPCSVRFETMLNDLLVDHQVVFDIHSYRPSPGVFNNATGLVCLTPSEGEAHKHVLTILQQLFPELVVLKGGNNYIINKAAELGKAALLLEVPYALCGECCFEGDWGQLAKVFERNHQIIDKLIHR